LNLSLTAADRPQTSSNNKALNRATLITEMNAQYLISIFQHRTMFHFSLAFLD